MSSFFDKPGYQTQKALWDFLHSKEGLLFTDEMSKNFNTMFPRGHEMSLRPFVEEVVKSLQKRPDSLEESFFELMGNVHPEAFDIFLRYGKDYAPYHWKVLPAEPLPGRCFGNALIFAELAKKHLHLPEPLTYVEGVAFGPEVKPMLHAWNAIGLNGNTAFDTTLYAISCWIRYFGIPFSIEEHTELRRLTPLGESAHLLFRKEYFTMQAKARLLSILEKRCKAKE